MAAILTVQHVDKAFGSRRVLGDVSFAVAEGERIGIVGLNGAGKSTLLRLLVGEDAPDAGLITRQRELTLEYVAQEPSLDGERTVAEVVREGLRAHQSALRQLATLETTIAQLGSQLGAQLSAETTLSTGESIIDHNPPQSSPAQPQLSTGESITTPSRRPSSIAQTGLSTGESIIAPSQSASPIAQPELSTDKSFIAPSQPAGSTAQAELSTAASSIAPPSQPGSSVARAELSTGESITAPSQPANSIAEAELSTAASSITPPSQPGSSIAQAELSTAASSITPSQPPPSQPGSSVARAELSTGESITAPSQPANSIAQAELSTAASSIAPPSQPGSSDVQAGLSTDSSVIYSTRASGASAAPGATREARESKLRAALEAQAALHAHIEASGGWDREHEIRTLAAALQLPPLTAKVATLSGGERRRVALARALLARPALLALDEPTNHLDPETVLWLETRLANWTGALLLVTHDRYFLDRVATRIVELDRGRLFAYDGGYTRFVEQQAERLADESNREDARRSFVRRELDWIRRGPKARGTKQKARIDRFDAAVAAAPGSEDKRPGPLTLRLPTGGRIGKTILELRDVGKSLGGKQLFNHLTLTMKPGDRIGIVGPNGAGKTTLVRTILGEVAPDSGEVVVGQNTRFSYLSQMRDSLRDDKTVLEEVSDGNDHVFLDDGAVHVRTFLRMLLFDDRFAETPVGALSGGERNRVQLARLLRRGGNLLVLDEPTNDLDLVTLSVLEDALTRFPGCALIVSHDRWFLDKVATGILAFAGNGQVIFYEGDYSSYLARHAAAMVEPIDSPVEKSVATPKPMVKPIAPAARKLTFKEKQELAGIEAAITAAEAEVETLQATLNDPAVYKTRAAEVPALVSALEAARAHVERLYARWQELESLV